MFALNLFLSSDAMTSVNQDLVHELFFYASKYDICSSCPQILVHVYERSKFLACISQKVDSNYAFLRSLLIVISIFSVRKNIMWAV